LSKLQLYFTSLLLFTALIANAATKDEIDDLMYKAFEFKVKKDFTASYNIYSTILNHKDDMTLSQRFNTDYSLLELTYILERNDDAKIYGIKLLALIKNEPDYVKNYKRIKYRICSSDDWAKFKYMFTDVCD